MGAWSLAEPRAHLFIRQHPPREHAMQLPTTIKLDRYGIGTVIVDGRDLSMSITPELTLTTSQDTGPVVTLHLAGLNLEVEADADVVIPEDVAAALELLGWTRP